MLNSMGNVALAMHLLMEKTNPASNWEPYINALPSSYSTVMYFSESELMELRGSPALVEALQHCKRVARHYAYFYRKFCSTMLQDYFTYEEYRWAVSTVMTRQNLVGKLDNYSSKGRVPSMTIRTVFFPLYRFPQCTKKRQQKKGHPLHTG